jgi:hypothetical protein
VAWNDLLPGPEKNLFKVKPVDRRRQWTARSQTSRKKILEFHPEIQQPGLNLDLSLDEAGQRYALKFSQGGEELGAYLDKQDAQECLAGRTCVNLQVQVTQLLAEFEDLLSPRKPG